MHRKTSSVADEIWYRVGLALLGALLGLVVAFLIGYPIELIDKFYVDLKRITIVGAISGAVFGAIFADLLMFAMQALIYFVIGIFGFLGNGFGG